jgi:hypothetical protein
MDARIPRYCLGQHHPKAGDQVRRFNGLASGNADPNLLFGDGSSRLIDMNLFQTCQEDRDACGTNQTPRRLLAQS